MSEPEENQEPDATGSAFFQSDEGRSWLRALRWMILGSLPAVASSLVCFSAFWLRPIMDALGIGTGTGTVIQLIVAGPLAVGAPVLAAHITVAEAFHCRQAVKTAITIAGALVIVVVWLLAMSVLVSELPIHWR